jgi:nucleoside-diphosphate-sugar epimerase
MQLSKKVRLDVTWCMFCQPIGRYIKLNQLMAYLVQELQEGRRPKFGTAENPFDMIVVADLAEALYLAGVTPLKDKKYYIGSGQPRQLKEYLKRAGELVAPDTELIFGERADDGLKFSYEWLDSETFMAETGFAASYSFDAGVKSVAAWVEECRTSEQTNMI